MKSTSTVYMAKGVQGGRCVTTGTKCTRTCVTCDEGVQSAQKFTILGLFGGCDTWCSLHRPDCDT